MKLQSNAKISPVFGGSEAFVDVGILNNEIQAHNRIRNNKSSIIQCCFYFIFANREELERDGKSFSVNFHQLSYGLSSSCMMSLLSQRREIIFEKKWQNLD